MLIGSWILIAFALWGEWTPRLRGAIQLGAVALLLAFVVTAWKAGNLRWNEWLMLGSAAVLSWMAFQGPDGPSVMNYAALSLIIAPLVKAAFRA